MKSDISEMKSCPFCGGEVAEHPNEKWRDTYFVVHHKADCYLHNHNLLPRNYRINEWNKRFK